MKKLNKKILITFMIVMLTVGAGSAILSYMLAKADPSGSGTTTVTAAATYKTNIDYIIENANGTNESTLPGYDETMYHIVEISSGAASSLNQFALENGEGTVVDYASFRKLVLTAYKTDAIPADMEMPVDKIEYKFYSTDGMTGNTALIDECTEAITRADLIYVSTDVNKIYDSANNNDIPDKVATQLDLYATSELKPIIIDSPIETINIIGDTNGTTTFKTLAGEFVKDGSVRNAFAWNIGNVSKKTKNKQVVKTASSKVSHLYCVADTDDIITYNKVPAAYKQAVDADGDPVYSSTGEPVYEQQVDADGNPVVDSSGDPVYVEAPAGAFYYEKLSEKNFKDSSNNPITISKIGEKPFTNPITSHYGEVITEDGTGDQYYVYKAATEPILYKDRDGNIYLVSGYDSAYNPQYVTDGSGKKVVVFAADSAVATASTVVKGIYFVNESNSYDSATANISGYEEKTYTADDTTPTEPVRDSVGNIVEENDIDFHTFTYKFTSGDTSEHVYKNENLFASASNASPLSLTDATTASNVYIEIVDAVTGNKTYSKINLTSVPIDSASLPAAAVSNEYVYTYDNHRVYAYNEDFHPYYIVEQDNDGNDHLTVVKDFVNVASDPNYGKPNYLQDSSSNKIQDVYIYVANSNEVLMPVYDTAGAPVMVDAIDSVGNPYLEIVVDGSGVAVDENAALSFFNRYNGSLYMPIVGTDASERWKIARDAMTGDPIMNGTEPKKMASVLDICLNDTGSVLWDAIASDFPTSEVLRAVTKRHMDDIEDPAAALAADPSSYIITTYPGYAIDSTNAIYSAYKVYTLHPDYISDRLIKYNKDANVFDGINFDDYDMIIIEGDLESTEIAPDDYNALIGQMLGNKHIIYDSKLIPVGNKTNNGFNAPSFNKLYSKLVDNRDVALYNSVLVCNKKKMDAYSSKLATKDTEIDIVNIINNGRYRYVGGSEDSSNNFTVLEIQPACPIDLELSKKLGALGFSVEYSDNYDSSLGYYVDPEYVSSASPDEILFDPLGVNSLSSYQNADGTYVDDATGTVYANTNTNLTDYYAWELSEAKILHLINQSPDFQSYNIDKVTVVHKSANEFQSSRESLLDTYDMIYIGGNNSGLKNLEYFFANNYGQAKDHIGSTNATYYNMYYHNGDLFNYPKSTYYGYEQGAIGIQYGNDITYNRLEEFKEYVNAGMPLVLSSDVTSAYDELDVARNNNSGGAYNLHKLDPDSNIVKLFDYIKGLKTTPGNVLWNFNPHDTIRVDNPSQKYKKTYSGFATVFGGNEVVDYTGATYNKPVASAANEAELLQVLMSSSIRPKFAVTYSLPEYKMYDKSTDLKSRTLKFEFDMITTAANTTFNLYIDDNGDSRFTDGSNGSDNEMVVSGVPASDGKLQYTVDADFFGPVYVKLEAVHRNDVTDVDGNVISSYNTRAGHTFFYKINPDDTTKDVINILQIYPETSKPGTFNGFNLYFCVECQQGLNNYTGNRYSYSGARSLNALKGINGGYVDGVSDNDSGFNKLYITNVSAPTSITSAIAARDAQVKVSTLDNTYSYKGNILGVHTHRFGIAHYDNTRTVAASKNVLKKYYNGDTLTADEQTEINTNTGWDNYSTNWADEVADDYDFNVTMINTAEFEKYCTDIESIYAGQNLETVRSQYRSLATSYLTYDLEMKMLLYGGVDKYVPAELISAQATVDASINSSGVSTLTDPEKAAIRADLLDIYQDKFSSYTPASYTAMEPQAIIDAINNELGLTAADYTNFNALLEKYELDYTNHLDFTNEMYKLGATYSTLENYAKATANLNAECDKVKNTISSKADTSGLNATGIAACGGFDTVFSYDNITVNDFLEEIDSWKVNHSYYELYSFISDGGGQNIASKAGYDLIGNYGKVYGPWRDACIYERYFYEKYLEMLRKSAVSDNGELDLTNVFSIIIVGPSNHFGDDDLKSTKSTDAIKYYADHEGKVLLFHDTIDVTGSSTENSRNMINELRSTFGMDARHLEPYASDADKVVSDQKFEVQLDGQRVDDYTLASNRTDVVYGVTENGNKQDTTFSTNYDNSNQNVTVPSNAKEAVVAYKQNGTKKGSPTFKIVLPDGQTFDYSSQLSNSIKDYTINVNTTNKVLNNVSVLLANTNSDINYNEGSVNNKHGIGRNWNNGTYSGNNNKSIWIPNIPGNATKATVDVYLQNSAELYEISAVNVTETGANDKHDIELTINFKNKDNHSQSKNFSGNLYYISGDYSSSKLPSAQAVTSSSDDFADGYKTEAGVNGTSVTINIPNSGEVTTCTLIPGTETIDYGTQEFIIKYNKSGTFRYNLDTTQDWEQKSIEVSGSATIERPNYTTNGYNFTTTTVSTTTDFINDQKVTVLVTDPSGNPIKGATPKVQKDGKDLTGETLSTGGVQYTFANYTTSGRTGSVLSTGTASLSGASDNQIFSVKVTGPSGAVVAGKKVTLKNSNNGASASSITDSTGVAKFTLSNYTVTKYSYQLAAGYDPEKYFISSLANNGTDDLSNGEKIVPIAIGERSVIYDAKDNAQGRALAMNKFANYDREAETHWITRQDNYYVNLQGGYAPTPGVVKRAASPHRQVTNRAQQNNKGVLTMYPFALSPTLNITATHPQTFVLDVEDENMTVYYSLSGGSNGSQSYMFAADPKNGAQNYFIYQYNNVTYCGAGHSSVTGWGTNNDDERKLYINVICNSLRKSAIGTQFNLYDYGATAQDVSRGSANTKVETDGSGNYTYMVNTTEDTPAFSFVVKPDISSGTVVKRVEAYYDLDITNVGINHPYVDPDGKVTYSHVLIYDTYDPNDANTFANTHDMVVKAKNPIGVNAPVYNDAGTEITSPFMKKTNGEYNLKLKQAYFDVYGGTYTYITVCVTTERKGREYKVYKRIKIMVTPEMFDLT